MVFVPGFLFLKSNSKSPPVYSEESFKETVTDNFLYFPCTSKLFGLL
jgi:hypothetical protein